MHEEERIKFERRASLRYKSWISLHLKFVRASLKDADHICVLTHAEKEYIKDNFSIPDERISVIYHSLPAHFRNLSEYSTPKEFKIIYVGSWLPKKGIAYLLKALESLCSYNIDFSATLAGIRAEESVVQRSLSDKLRARIKIIPYIANRDLPKVYLSHSVFIFPSLYEGFGVALTEAMACGIPIITTQAGIAKEWIQEKINGIVVPYHDSSAIYEALVWAFNHPDEMRKYGENAKKLIQQIDQGQEARERMEIYQNLIKDS